MMLSKPVPSTPAPSTPTRPNKRKADLMSSANPDIDPGIEEQLRKQLALNKALQLFMGKRSLFSEEEIIKQIKPIVKSLLTIGDVDVPIIQCYYEQIINDPNSLPKLQTLVNHLSTVEIMFLWPALNLQKIDHVSRRKINEIQLKYIDVSLCIMGHNNSNRKRSHSI
jgi:hypothetical protein